LQRLNSVDMAINLQKGQKIDIGLTKISVGLGWNPNQGTGFDFDLDASAFLLDSTKKIPLEGFFVFYGNANSPDMAIHHTGDDPNGGNSEFGDDEAIKVDLEKVDPRIGEILFVVTIHEYETRRQNFGQVKDSYIRIVDDSNNIEIAKYELGEDFSIETAVEFGRLYRREGKWKFEASGIGYKQDLSFFVNRYYTGQVIK
jgi:tellurium resistance protein TerD